VFHDACAAAGAQELAVGVEHGAVRAVAERAEHAAPGGAGRASSASAVSVRVAMTTRSWRCSRPAATTVTPVACARSP
jgi:hypothetical protein